MCDDITDKRSWCMNITPANTNAHHINSGNYTVSECADTWAATADEVTQFNGCEDIMREHDWYCRYCGKRRRQPTTAISLDGLAHGNASHSLALIRRVCNI
jgi:hypothetical protein